MRIGIPKEVQAGETRVALIPSLIPLLIKDRHEVLVEAGAGVGACFSDTQYLQAGASLIEGAPALYEQVDMIFKVQPPQMHPTTHLPEAGMVREGSAYIGFLSPFTHLDVMETFARRKITAFAMDFVPRLARAQSMDALSSMSTVAGYKAVLLATEHLGKMFPLLMTAAGTITPATVLVLGAGVAGLQAIATAKRLGARVEAFDARPAVREQIHSLGATFIEMELPAGCGNGRRLCQRAICRVPQARAGSHLCPVPQGGCGHQHSAGLWETRPSADYDRDGQVPSPRVGDR